VEGIALHKTLVLSGTTALREAFGESVVYAERRRVHPQQRR